MSSRSRAARVAHGVLQAERSVIPVPVDQIAARYAVVVRQPLPEDVSGMLVPLAGAGSNARWAIVVNSSDSPKRRRFTIAHELGHLLMHKYSAPHADGRVQIRFRNEESATGAVREEIEANQFAAELLMPERYVRAYVSRLRLDPFDPADDASALKKLQELARKLQVSVQAVSIRIASLGLK